jgi:hypothetical protein
VLILWFFVGYKSRSLATFARVKAGKEQFDDPRKVLGFLCGGMMAIVTADCGTAGKSSAGSAHSPGRRGSIMIPALVGTSVHRLLKLAANGALIVLATWVPTEGTQEAPKQTDIWVNPGVSVGASTDPTTFVNTTDAGFIGVLERLSVGFVDDKQEWLFTTMTFRVTEVVFPHCRLALAIVSKC